MARRATPTPDTTIGQRIRDRRMLKGGGWSIRFAADRAGMSHSTWSRIERGVMSADNRFVLAAIANALECEVNDLTDAPSGPVGRESEAARALVHRIRAALIDGDLDEPTTRTPPPIETLARHTELVIDLRNRCDYFGVGQYLPTLLLDLHAAAAGPHRDRALRMLVEASFAAAGTIRYIADPGDSYVAAERCRQAAEELDDPVLIALSAYERSHVATACGAYSRAYTLATRAADQLSVHLSAPDAEPMYGQLLLTVAFAGLGVGRDGSEQVAEAAAIAARTGETTALRLHFGPVNTRFWRVAMETDAGDPGRAVAIARDTTPTAVSSISRQVAFYADLARALARTRRDREAVRALVTAERMAPLRIRSSAIAQETARGLLERAQRRAGGSELRSLCARMGLPN